MKMSEVDLLIESTITEAPVGVFKRGALKLASKLGSQKAAGQEVTADIANKLRKEYSRYLGLTGYEADRESLEAFLGSKGLSSDSLDTAISTATGTGPSGQDWRIDTGPRTGATNQKEEPVVDIGSATDEVPSLDSESPIEKARAKRIAAQQAAVQQLRGQKTQEPVAKQDPLAAMGKGYVPPIEPSAQEQDVTQPVSSSQPMYYSADDYVKNNWYHKTANPSGTELPPPPPEQPVPSATGQQAAAALSKIKTQPDPMKGRGSLVSKLKQQPVVKPNRLAGMDTGYVPPIEPTTAKPRPAISAKAGKVAAGQTQPQVPQFPSASAMSKATAEKKAELDTKLQAIDDAKAALAANPKDRKLKSALNKAESDYDAFVSTEIKPTDLKDKLAAKVDQVKKGEEPQTQLELPTENPVDTIEVEKAQDKVEKAKTEYEKVNKAGVAKKTKEKKLDKLNKANAELATVTGTEPEVVTAPKTVSMQSPVTAVKPEPKPEVKPETPVAKPEPKAEPVAKKATEKKPEPKKHEPKQRAATAKAVEKAKDGEDYYSKLSTAQQQEIDDAMALMAKKQSGKPPTQAFDPKEVPVKKLKAMVNNLDKLRDAADEAEAFGNARDIARANHAVKNAIAARDYLKSVEQNPKMALAASIEHEYDYLLAEAAFSNKEIDKIILAVTQDNIRKGIISIAGVPKPKAKGKETTAKTDAGQYATTASTGLGGKQYAPQAKSTSAKTLDLSDFNVERLIDTINHILKKEELQPAEMTQLKKLMRELKAVREGRAILANQLTEAPMGLGQRLATGVASKFSSQAAGQLDVGKIANQYKPEYSRWLGTTGANPDAQSLIDFFQSKRLDTSKIQQIADSVAPGATRLTSQQLDTIIMQITQDNIRKGVITPAAAAKAGGQPAQQPAAQSGQASPTILNRMKSDPAISSHPEYVRQLDAILAGLK